MSLRTLVSGFRFIVFYNSLINLASLSLFALIAIFREGITSSLGILQPTSLFYSSLAIVQAS